MTPRKRKNENIVFCEIKRPNVTWGVLEYGVRYVISVSNNAPIQASLTFYLKNPFILNSFVDPRRHKFFSSGLNCRIDVKPIS